MTLWPAAQRVYVAVGQALVGDVLVLVACVCVFVWAWVLRSTRNGDDGMGGRSVWRCEAEGG
jgi:hypothetical protein